MLNFALKPILFFSCLYIISIRKYFKHAKMQKMIQQTYIYVYFYLILLNYIFFATIESKLLK